MPRDPDDSADPELDNPYAPGEAAVDPEADAEFAEHSDWTITPGRPREPSIGRAYANFQVLLNRSIGMVGVAWAAVAISYLALIIGLSVVVVGVGTATAPSPGQTLAQGGLFAMLASVIALGTATLFLGLTRPLREVGFRGEGAVPGVGTAFTMALERFFPIVGFLLAAGIVFFVPFFGLGAVAELAGLPDSAGLIALPVLAVLWYFLAPLFYIVPASDLSLGDSFSEAYSVATSYPGYLLLSYLVLAAVAFGFGCMFSLFAAVPIFGIICGFIGMFFLNFGGWIAFTALFATVEEVRGGFEPEM